MAAGAAAAVADAVAFDDGWVSEEEVVGQAPKQELMLAPTDGATGAGPQTPLGKRKCPETCLSDSSIQRGSADEAETRTPGSIFKPRVLFCRSDSSECQPPRGQSQVGELSLQNLETCDFWARLVRSTIAAFMQENNLVQTRTASCFCSCCGLLGEKACKDVLGSLIDN